MTAQPRRYSANSLVDVYVARNACHHQDDALSLVEQIHLGGAPTFWSGVCRQRRQTPIPQQFGHNLGTFDQFANASFPTTAILQPLPHHVALPADKVRGVMNSQIVWSF